MRSHLKKILTWTNMSAMVIALTVANPATAETRIADFGFRVYQTQKQEVEHSMARQLTCLARNVFYEAASEPFNGQLAVAQVTVNRARSGLFPRDLCAVVSQSTVTEDGKRICQFSWYCDKNKDKDRIISKNNNAYVAARKVLLEGESVAQLDKHYLYFHHESISNDSKSKVQIGNHVFYKRQK